MTAATLPFPCLSWNVHRGRGEDGIVDPARTVGVLLEEAWRAGTAALVLQEADEEVPPHEGILDIARIEAGTGLACIHREAAHRWGAQSHGFLGTIVFLDPTFTVEEVVLLDLPGHCHRGAVIVDARRDGVPVRLVGTHLSLWQGLRMAQMRAIGQHLFRRAPRPVVLCGDLNEWRPWGGLALAPGLVGMALEGPARGTFPVAWPVLPLDRVLAGGGARVEATEVLDGPGIRMASDHRPLAAQVLLPG